jgi:hypothetical protein
MTVTVPVLSSPAREAVTIDDAEVLQVTFEHAGPSGSLLLPTSLTPTRPMLVTFLVVRAAGGPVGPFTVAQVRLSCRSGVRARAFVAAQVVDAGESVAARLAERWGMGGPAGHIALRRGYDAVEASTEGFGVALVDPAPIGVHDVQYVTGLVPVRRAQGGNRLLQVEFEMEPQRVERGRPVLRHVDPGGGGFDGLHPSHPVAATIAVGRFTLPALRFLLDPDQPPHLGTERL